MPRDWWGGSRRGNLEAYSQSWRWKQASISTETTNFSMRGQTEDRWFHHHLLRLHNGVKSFFKDNHAPLFTLKYGRLWQQILSPFMYESYLEWHLQWQQTFPCVDKQKTDGFIIIFSEYIMEQNPFWRRINKSVQLNWLRKYLNLHIHFFQLPVFLDSVHKSLLNQIWFNLRK